MKEIRKQYDVTRQVREELAKAFNASNVSVWRALSFRDNSEKSKKIRCLAGQKGGVVMHITPEIETIHDCDGYMRQYFPGSVLIEVNKKNGNCALLVSGTTVETWENITIMQLEKIQAKAAQMCGSKVAI